MSDLELPFVDQQALKQCLGFPKRQEPPSALEYLAAELWIRAKYKAYFRTLPTPQLVTWQLERFWTGYETGDLVIEAAMELLESDFRNLFSDSFIRRFKRAARRGATPEDLIKLVAEASPGGALKPDMLGIYADNTTFAFDAVEVGTEKTAQSTYDELHKKLGILRQEVLVRLRMKLEALQWRYAERGKGRPLPQSYRASASAFRLENDAWVMPLPVRIGANGSARYADWICFHPTKTWRPNRTAPTDQPLSGAADRPGTDGLMIYHIHRAQLPRLPDAVRRHVEIELRKWQQQQGYVLELNPAFAYAARQSASAWSQDAIQLLAIGGAALLLIVLVAFAWEIGLVAGGVALAEAGLAALAETPALLLRAVMSSAQVADVLWPAATGLLPFVPRLARGM